MKSKQGVKYDMSSVFLVLLVTLPIINYYIAEIFWAFSMRNPFSEYIYALIDIVGIISVLRQPDFYRVTAIVSFFIILLPNIHAVVLSTAVSTS